MVELEELLGLMARAHARVSTSIWQDEEFVALSAMAQRVYFLALSQAGLSYCGVVSYTPRRWARLAADTSPKAIERASAELAEARFVIVDEETEELCVRTFVKHDGILKSPNLITAMRRDLASVHSERIREGILEGLPPALRKPLPEPPPEPFSKPPSSGSHTHSAEPQPPPQPQPPSSKSRGGFTSAGQPVENDDDDQDATQRTAVDQLIRAACHLIAIGELQLLRADRPDLDNPPPASVREIGWLEAATDRAWERLDEQARKLLAEDPHLDAQQLAAALTPLPSAPDDDEIDHADLSAAAQERVRADHEARRTEEETLALAQERRRLQAEELLAKMSSEDRKRLEAEVRERFGPTAIRPVIESAMRSAVLDRQAS